MTQRRWAPSCLTDAQQHRAPSRTARSVSPPCPAAAPARPGTHAAKTRSGTCQCAGAPRATTGPAPLADRTGTRWPSRRTRGGQTGTSPVQPGTGRMTRRWRACPLHSSALTSPWEWRPALGQWPPRRRPRCAPGGVEPRARAARKAAGSLLAMRSSAPITRQSDLAGCVRESLQVLLVLRALARNQFTNSRTCASATLTMGVKP